MRDFFGHEQRRAANLFACSGVMTDDFRAGRLSRKGLGHRKIIVTQTVALSRPENFTVAELEPNTGQTKSSEGEPLTRMRATFIFQFSPGVNT
jgi:hypothetical protein